MKALSDLPLTHEQSAIVQAPLERKLFLEGPAGVGKSTTGAGTQYKP